MSAVFTCPECHNSYAPHWRAENRAGVCRSCAEERAAICQVPGHPDHAGSPCYFQRTEQPGDPCRYCARPFPEGQMPCPHCWTYLTDMPMADIRALFVADGTFETTLDLGGSP